MRDKYLLFVLPRMRLTEKILTGVWAALGAANVAILASALPYLYTSDMDMKCWSFALVNASFYPIKQVIIVISTITILFNISRTLMSAAKFTKLLGNEVLSILGHVFWLIIFSGGTFVFCNFLYAIGFILADPPPMPLPPETTNRAACVRLLLDARPPDDLMTKYVLPAMGVSKPQTRAHP